MDKNKARGKKENKCQEQAFVHSTKITNFINEQINEKSSIKHCIN
jgi:hypothetical protein